MNKDRRAFLRNTSLATGLLLLQQPFRSLAATTGNATYLPGNNRALQIWHTNDMHGQVPRLRPSGDQGILLDAGDFLHGTANGNVHRETIDAMNRAGYHAATIGNRELAGGQAALAALIPHMQFALVNCNYQFTDKTLARQVLPYKIVYAGSLKVGITGVGPALPADSGVTFLPPVQAANDMAVRLKEEHGCHIVVCLSHLGFQQPEGVADNRDVAAGSTHIDWVVGGHQQKIIRTTMVLHNANQHEVYLSQSGANGSMIGSMKMLFDETRRRSGIEPGCIMA
ncbi:bifunctional metallophosphatase/5'-nucleotidase [Chitinophaga varians]|uniref:bifunctional metallophosphatase/5'-nucleotidase n=1 Tax=Chitinophaga varians TaxID=2202339 RepID=UPI00165F8A7B|nr:bifunctional metallophosphatase/5'-nucleotidase [Chitinophaga varians]MBC9909480.1 bifunctional metallophosphatase/5'-nucleotidase [Chitinophaga varians]